MSHQKNQTSGLAGGRNDGRWLDGSVANLGQIQFEILFAFTEQVFGILLLDFLKPIFDFLTIGVRRSG